MRRLAQIAKGNPFTIPKAKAKPLLKRATIYCVQSCLNCKYASFKRIVKKVRKIRQMQITSIRSKW